jgi:hypothetical protein
MPCSICKQVGHNKTTCTTHLNTSPIKNKMPKEKKEKKADFTEDVLIKLLHTHMSHVKQLMEISNSTGIELRLPNFPEYLSENIIKFIIHYKLGDKTSNWNCKKGDLLSDKEGVQECKAFTSDGPLSFSPTTEWDVIYFLDAREWLLNRYVLYKSNLRRTMDEWKNIEMSKKETFEVQSKQGRRPHIGWEKLKPQIIDLSTIYEGTFEDIFKPVEEEV